MLIEDVKTELVAEWNDTVITVNNIYLGTLTETVDSKALPEIKILEQVENMNPIGDGSAEISEYQFIIQGFAKTRSDIKKVYSEIKRIINAKYIAGGWWRVNNKIYEDNPRYITATVTCSQSLFQTT